jgi:hypothetical protein
MRARIGCLRAPTSGYLPALSKQSSVLTTLSGRRSGQELKAEARMQTVSRTLVAALATSLVATLSSCTTARDTLPPRSATEQLLISNAADRAAAQLTVGLRPGTKVYLDSSGFEGYDAKYAIGAITEQVLLRGSRLVPDRKSADVVVAIRAGALSVDQNDTLVGIPSLSVPVPLAGTLTTPELALFAKHQYRGVAKFAATAYDADTGKIIAASGPSFGFSHRTHWVVLFLIAWNTDDLLPEKYQ